MDIMIILQSKSEMDNASQYAKSEKYQADGDHSHQDQQGGHNLFEK